MSKKINKFYIKPEDFQQEYDKAILIDEVTPNLLKMFFTIAEKSSVLLKLKNQQDIDACVNFAVSICWATKWKKYNIDRTSNIFSFFTTVILNDMRTHKNFIQKNKDSSISIDAIFNSIKDK